MNESSDFTGGRVFLKDLNVIFSSSRGEQVHAVKDFSLATEPGEFVCLIGPSGCGKSTVLNVVAGFVKATSGIVTLDDHCIDKPHPERGVVFQDYALFPWKSVLSNVEFGLKMQNVAKAERRAIAQEKIELVGLKGFESKYPQELSGGMKQRVGIARILANNPRVMLMDEPFGALDAQTREVMQEQLLEVWEQYRKTVIFITHDLDEAIFLSDTICLMTARPGSVRTIIKNPLPRPRTPDLLVSEEFMKIKRELSNTLREEISTAMAQRV